MAKRPAAAPKPETAPAPTPGILQPVMVPIADLTVDPRNARKHEKENRDAVRESIARFGQHRLAVVQKKGMVVRIGNAMVEEMKAAGHTEVACLVIDEDDDTAAARALADNRAGELADWNNPVLKGLVDDLEKNGWDMAGLGFDEDFLSSINTSDPLTEEPATPPLLDEAVTRRGDCWVLGPHRLLCGDSSVEQDVRVLVNGCVIGLLNTDPPYNVKVEPRSNNAIAAGLSSFPAGKSQGEYHQQASDLSRHPGKSKPTTTKLRAKDRELSNDFMSDEAFEKMLDAWFGNAAKVMAPGASFYAWGGYANVANYPPALLRAGFKFAQALIWVKGHPVMGRKDFMGNHEWCFYGWKEGAAHRFYGPKNVPDVWEVKKVPPVKMIHLTEKPVSLAARAIEYSTRPGANVLDLFGGSGSTLMAADQMGRNAFLMEIDPLYADVIIRRWQAHTGSLARLGSSDGPTWAATAKQRNVDISEPAMADSKEEGQ